MKTILFASSIFFLLGLKLSSIIDIRGKAGAVENIITNKIIKQKPAKALHLFKDSEQDDEKKDETKKEADIQKAEPEKQEKTDN